MTRILHTADLHLDAPLRTLALRDPELRARVETASRGALERIVDVAIERQTAALTIGGDLFDGRERSAKTAAFFLRQMARLREAGIKVFVIRGNHDAENPALGEIELPDNVHLFTGHGGAVELDGQDVVIHGVSFAERHVPKSLLSKFRAPVAGKINVGLLHTSLGSSEGHDIYAPCTEAELAALGFDVWALGHIHRRRVVPAGVKGPLIVMPGTPQGRDIGEEGPKSATLLHIAPGDVRAEEIPTHRLEFRRTELVLGGLDDTADVCRALARHIAEEASGRGAADVVLRIAFTGDGPVKWAVRRDLDALTELARTEARATGTVWLETLVVEDGPGGTRPTAYVAPSGPALADPALAGPVPELEAIMGELAEDPGMQALIAEDIAELVADLPREARDLFGEDEASRTKRMGGLSRAAVAEMGALLRGAGTIGPG